MAKDTRWDRNLSVAPDAGGLVGHAGAVLLRKLADQCGLTSALGAALGRKGKFPLIDRGMALVSMAVAIALGAASMSDIAVLAHQEPVLGAAPGDTTVRRTLELADARTLDKIARARAAVRAHVWQLHERASTGTPPPPKKKKKRCFAREASLFPHSQASLGRALRGSTGVDAARVRLSPRGCCLRRSWRFAFGSR